MHDEPNNASAAGLLEWDRDEQLLAPITCINDDISNLCVVNRALVGSNLEKVRVEWYDEWGSGAK
jgi:hypothetical protein